MLPKVGGDEKPCYALVRELAIISIFLLLVSESSTRLVLRAITVLIAAFYVVHRKHHSRCLEGFQILVSQI
jgi:hypothetical protein